MDTKKIEEKIKVLLSQRNQPGDSYLEEVKQLLEEVDENEYPLITIKILLLMSMGNMAFARYEEVSKVYQKIELLCNKFPEDNEIQALGLRSLGTYNWNNSNFEKALEFFIRDLEFEKDSVNLIFLKQKIGMTYFKMNDFENTFSYFNEAYQGRELVKDNIARADIISWFAIVNNEVGMFVRALELTNEAIEINLEISNNVGLASNYNTIGLANKSLGNLEQALKYFFKAEEYALKAKSYIHLANTYNNLASVYHQVSDKKKAIEYFEKSLENRRKSLQIDLLAVTLKNLIILCLEEGKEKQAEQAFEELEELYKKSPVMKVKIMLLYAKAAFSANERDYGKAIDYTKENLRISEEISYTVNKIPVYELLSLYYEGLDNFREALNYQKLLKKTLQEINFEEETKSIRNLNLIHQQITDQFIVDKKIQEERIKAILAMSITVNHEINQPLMQIQGNLDMLSQSIESNSEMERYQKYCLRIQEGVQKISTLTEKFLNHTSHSYTDYLQDTEMIEFSNE